MLHDHTPLTRRSFMMEYDVHTLLDFVTFVATAWVLFQMRTKLARSYSARKDSARMEYIVRVSFRVARNNNIALT